ncbi:hypothetical protein DY000_02054352 [Brassica cretica]|uniref:K Homology domain-containing protein n=1 Tax=Brassica cretica TaxID=69181 RepID=A0ABQ7AL76_BRACR|nr:hypothetical protein DY000_02054352 [Brassica cretica]
MAAVADSVDNGTTIFPENQTPTPSGVTATTLLNENSDAFPELNQPDSSAAAERWPGWPGDCVFRVIVPVAKVGAIIGRKGDIIRKMCEETRARIKVLDGPATTQDRVVLISAKEDLEAYMSPAMGAVVRVFRRVSELPDNDDDDDVQKAGSAVSSYLARVSQVRQEEPLAENKSSLHTLSSNVMESDLSLLARREPLFLERHPQVESRVQPSAASMYSQDPVLAATLARVSAAFVTQVSQTMQIPFSYAEDIIGLEGANIAYIRRSSGATVTIQESPHPDEITVEIKGTSSQVQTAQLLIQEFISNHKEPVSVSGGYARVDTGYVPAVYPPQLSNRQEPLTSTYTGTETVQYRPTSYSQLPGQSTYTPTLTGQTYDTEYRPASDVNGYSSYSL